MGRTAIGGAAVSDELDGMSWTQLRALAEAQQRELDRLNSEIVRLRKQLLERGEK